MTLRINDDNDLTASLLANQQESAYKQEDIAAKVNETAKATIGISKTITSMASQLQASQKKKLTLPDGSTYNGEVNANDQPHGKGVILYAANDLYKRKKYDGEFIDGKREGTGILTFGGTAEGTRYDGAFSDDALTGIGTMIWPSGQRYTGGWLNAKFHGYGLLTYPPNDTYARLNYRGQFQGGLREGTGLLTWCGAYDGQTYSGNFKADKFDGQGVMELSSGEKYNGKWADGKKSGHGTLFYEQFDDQNRWKFVGEFAHNKANGEGTLYYLANADGYTRSNLTGIWVDDKFQTTCCCVIL